MLDAKSGLHCSEKEEVEEVNKRAVAGHLYWILYAVLVENWMLSVVVLCFERTSITYL